MQSQLTLSEKRLDVRSQGSGHTTGAYLARCIPTWEEAAAPWRATPRQWTPTTPFQNLHWLDAWYGTIGSSPGVVPLPVEVRSVPDESAIALLPLVMTRRQGLRVITFADCELTDYNAPLIRGDQSPRALASRRFWRSVRRALPQADLIELHKMPVMRATEAADAAHLPGAGPSAAQGFVVRAGDDWEEFRRGLKRDVRADTARCWRQLEQIPGLTFQIIDTVERAIAVVDEMDHQQRRRIAAAGGSFTLDEPAPAAFYRDLIRRGLPAGYLHITAITTPDTLVAAAFGLVGGERYTVIRHSNAGPEWHRYSPSRAVLLKTMHGLHERGFRAFDYSIGDYDYKRRLGAVPVPLVNLVQPLSIFGLGAAARARAAMELRRRPALDERVRRLFRSA